jgi:hypothetical protein
VTEGGFACALDLVKYMREKHGDYFSIQARWGPPPPPPPPPSPPTGGKGGGGVRKVQKAFPSKWLPN